ncbi:MAG: hypothetical protein AAGF11_40795 [Myxococcota bacterium]
MRWSDERRRDLRSQWLRWSQGLWATSLVMLLGCSSVEDAGVPVSSVDGDGFEEPADPWGGDAENDSMGSGDSDGDPADDGGFPLDVGSGEAPQPPEPGMFDGCPGALPNAWIFCEDFELLSDPADVALDYQELDGAFTLVDNVGASGHHAMEVHYREGEEAAGRMVLSFGASPIDHGGRPSFASEESFPEIYWRVRVMTAPGWPDVGPGQLTRTLSFADETWSEAVVAHLRSVGGDVVMEAVPVTCVSDDEVACAGFDDQGSLEPLGPLPGQAPIYAEPESGQWHCIEGHLALNDPGLANGVLEFWIDEQWQAGSSDLDLRGRWTDYAINALVIDNHWPGGAPAPLYRWIDDIVISSEPIGCDIKLDDAAPG